MQTGQLNAALEADVSSRATGVKSEALTRWSVVALLVGSIPLGESGIYVSHLMLLAVSVPVLAFHLGMRRYAAVLSCLAALAALTAIPILAGGTGNPRFLPEQAKMSFALLGAVGIGLVVAWYDLRSICRTLPPVVAAMAVVVFLAGWGDYYGEGGRFGIPAFGSPNSTAFILAMSLALALYAGATRIRPSKLQVLLDIGLALVLSGFLIGTQSLGGILSGGFIVLRFFGFRMKVLLSGAAWAVGLSVAAALWVPGIEVPELIGSGRLVIWQYLLLEIAASDPLQILLGMGPGAIDIKPWFTLSVVSAHSMYLEVMYSYGLVGLATFLVGIVKLGRRLKRASLGAEQRKLLEAVYLGLIAGFFVDTYLLTAQLVWFGALLIGMFGLLYPRRRAGANRAAG